MRMILGTIGVAGMLAFLAIVAVMAVLLWNALGGKGSAGASPHRRRRGLVGLANEGTHGTGNISKQTDAVITERYLLAKIGSDATHVNICGAADTPIGVIKDEAAAIGDYITVGLLGSHAGTIRMVASGAITQGAFVEPAANGRVQTLGGGVGVHQIVGRALDAAANAGDVIEVDPICFIRDV